MHRKMSDVSRDMMACYSYKRDFSDEGILMVIALRIWAVAFETTYSIEVYP